MGNESNKRTRSATRPIPPAVREPFFLAMWDLAWSGHFYRHVPEGGDEFLRRFGSGSIIARRHGLTVLWLTAMAGRFCELARAHVVDVDNHSIRIARAKRGADHAIAIDPALIACTAAWYQRIAIAASDPHDQTYRVRRWAVKIHNSQYLLPSASGKQMNVNVFNRDVAGPLGCLFGIRLSSHCFRDTACQQAMAAVKADANLDVRAVQRIMGHRSLRTTEHYIAKQEGEQLQLPLYSD